MDGASAREWAWSGQTGSQQTLPGTWLREILEAQNSQPEEIWSLAGLGNLGAATAPVPYLYSVVDTRITSHTDPDYCAPRSNLCKHDDPSQPAPPSVRPSGVGLLSAAPARPGQKIYPSSPAPSRSQHPLHLACYPKNLHSSLSHLVSVCYGGVAEGWIGLSGLVRRSLWPLWRVCRPNLPR